MNLVVCVKQVPDTNEVKIDPVTNNLVREGVPGIINPPDLNAIEEALKIRDFCGGTLTAVSMGPPQAVEILDLVLKMGIDRAILLSDKAFAGADTLATGYTLSVLIKTLDPDLVFCGVEAIDGATGQVGPSLAENLGFPQLTYVNKIINVNETEIEVSRERKEVYEILTCNLPAVVCILRNINTPREAKANIVNRKPEIVSTAELNFDFDRIGLIGSPTRVAKIDITNKKGSGFVTINSSLPVEERIYLIVNGGIIPRKINLIRGTPNYLAEIIFNDNVLKSYFQN